MIVVVAVAVHGGGSSRVAKGSRSRSTHSGLCHLSVAMARNRMDDDQRHYGRQ